MKHLFTAALTALMSSMALANFVGMEYEAVAETANGTTYRVYATFDNPTDEIVAFYALETAPMVVGVSTSFTKTQWVQFWPKPSTLLFRRVSFVAIRQLVHHRFRGFQWHQ